MAFVTNTAEGTRHLGHVLLRWWLLLVGGTALALFIGFVAIIGSPTRYAATSLVGFDQPELVPAPEGKNVVDKLAELMPTFAQLASSDDVLSAAADNAKLSLSRDDLRGAVSVSQPLNTITLSIRVERPKRADTQQLADGLVAALRQRVEAKSGPGNQRFALTVLRVPDAHEVTQNATRTLVLAFVLGLGISAVAAVVLEQS